MPLYVYSNAVASTASDIAASERASVPEATRAPEFVCSPFFFTYLPSSTFVITATAIMTSDTFE